MNCVGIAHERVERFFRNDYSEWLRDAGIAWHVVDWREPSIKQETKILVTATLTEEQLERLPHLEAVIVPFSGINQLAVGALVQRGVKLFNTTVHSKFVAERALLLTLAVLGKLMAYHKGLEAGEWAGRAEMKMVPWHSLFDKKVGIYGYGKVGSDLAKLLGAFNCTIGTVAYKERRYEGVQSLPDLAALADWCDVLIITAPLNESTVGSVDRMILQKLAGKVLINVGRGEIVEEAALYDVLKAETLLGFGSDVWYQYPTADAPICQPSAFPMTACNKIVITPHNGGFEEKSDEIKYKDLAAKIGRLLKGDFREQLQI